MDSKSHFILRLWIIKTVFCPNLKFRQLLKLTLPTPREPQELTASDQIRDNRDNVMKQRDSVDWSLNSVTDPHPHRVIWRKKNCCFVKLI